MRKLLKLCTASVTLFIATGAANAECSVSSDRGVIVRPLDATVQADADLIASMTILPKLMHVDYNSAAKKSGCDLGQLATGNSTYELWGDDSGGRERKAIPSQKGAPVALVLPIVDLMKQLTTQGKGKQAQVEGYLLATISKGDLTGWRYYTGMPDPGTLKHDMAESLAGNGNPIFRASADGTVKLFVPKS